MLMLLDTGDMTAVQSCVYKCAGAGASVDAQPCGSCDATLFLERVPSAIPVPGGFVRCLYSLESRSFLFLVWPFCACQGTTRIILTRRLRTRTCDIVTRQCPRPKESLPASRGTPRPAVAAAAQQLCRRCELRIYSPARMFKKWGGGTLAQCCVRSLYLCGL